MAIAMRSQAGHQFCEDFLFVPTWVGASKVDNKGTLMIAVLDHITLTRLIREHTELRTPKKRSGTYSFGPGEEMQHDTSPHHITLGGKEVKAQCANQWHV